MENPNFTKMSPDYKKRFRNMIEKDKKEKEEKARIKAKKEEEKKRKAEEEKLKKLYNKSNMN
tara:strand:+ start:1055 stop:1240 length:186 start_codon:yes stop_codon:yes gene_type:complete